MTLGKIFDDLPADALLRMPEVRSLCGLGRSTIYRTIQRGRFPAPIKLGAVGAVAWRAGHIRAWLANPSGWLAE
jgi:prophage regulatory protein